MKAFNAANRSRKRGVATVKKQGFVCLFTDDTCFVTIDGSEIGQGMNTKFMQYVAHYLSQIVPGSQSHGGSTTSEGVCEAVREAIAKLTERLAPNLE